MTLKFFIHYGIHFLLPIALSLIFFKEKWIKAYLIFLLSMLIDLDHLLANPVFEPTRCSINFHPLHTYYAMVLYIGLLFFKKSRILGIALLLHMLADAIDCVL